MSMLCRICLFGALAAAPFFVSHAAGLLTPAPLTSRAEALKDFPGVRIFGDKLKPKFGLTAGQLRELIRSLDARLGLTASLQESATPAGPAEQARFETARRMLALLKDQNASPQELESWAGWLLRQLEDQIAGKVWPAPIGVKTAATPWPADVDPFMKDWPIFDGTGQRLLRLGGKSAAAPADPRAVESMIARLQSHLWPVIAIPESGGKTMPLEEWLNGEVKNEADKGTRPGYAQHYTPRSEKEVRALALRALAEHLLLLGMEDLSGPLPTPAAWMPLPKPGTATNVLQTLQPQFPDYDLKYWYQTIIGTAGRHLPEGRKRIMRLQAILALRSLDPNNFLPEARQRLLDNLAAIEKTLGLPEFIKDQVRRGKAGLLPVLLIQPLPDLAAALMDWHGRMPPPQPWLPGLEEWWQTPQLPAANPFPPYESGDYRVAAGVESLPYLPHGNDYQGGHRLTAAERGPMMRARQAAQSGFAFPTGYHYLKIYIDSHGLPLSLPPVKNELRDRNGERVLILEPPPLQEYDLVVVFTHSPNQPWEYTVQIDVKNEASAQAQNALPGLSHDPLLLNKLWDLFAHNDQLRLGYRQGKFIPLFGR